MSSRLEAHVRDVLSSPEWRLYKNVHIEEVEETPGMFSAMIRSDRWNIHIQYDPQLEETLNQMVDECDLRYLFPDPFATLIKTALTHEEGHWSVCPFDWYPFEDLLAGCSDALRTARLGPITHKDKEKRNEFIQALRYFLNNVEDLIANVVKTHRDPKQEYHLGLGLYTIFNKYLDYVAAGRGQFQALTPCSTIITDLENRLCQRNTDLYETVECLYDPHLRFDNCYPLRKMGQKLLAGFFGDGDLAKRVVTRTTSYDDKRQVVDIMRDRRPGNWYRIARDYTDLLLPFYLHDQERARKEQKGQGSSFLQTLLPDPDQGKKQKKCSAQGGGQGEDDQSPGQGSGEGQEKGENKPQPGQGNQGDDDKGKGQGQGEEKGDKGDEDKPKPGQGKGEGNENKPGQGEKPIIPDLFGLIPRPTLQRVVGIGTEKGRTINYAAHRDILEALYRQRAVEILSDYQREDRQGDTTPIAYLTRTPVTPDEMHLRRIDWARSRVFQTPQGRRLHLVQRDIAIEIPDPSSPGNLGFPDLAFINDTSGTMKADLMKGTGPYDMLLRGDFTLLEHVERNELAYYMKFAAVNFSGTTYFSGWHPYREIDVVIDELFRFQNGGTKLAPRIVERLCTEATHPFLALLTTDGLLDSYRRAADALIDLVNAGNKLCVFGIVNPRNSPEPFLRLLEDHAEIHRLKTAEDLVGLHIGQAEKNYGRIGTRQAGYR